MAELDAPIDTVSVAITADTRAFRTELADTERTTRGFAATLADAFTAVTVKGKDVGDVIGMVGQRLSSLALNAALKPLEQGVGGLLEGLLSGNAFARGGVLSGGGAGVEVRPFAQGGVLAGHGGAAPARPFALGGALAGEAGGLQVRPFAQGGVVAAPTYFPMAGGLGLMGERGAEAILPLARGADGRLGVRTEGGAGATSVVVNVSTPDPGAFRRSDVYLSGLVARAVARGQRGA